ncbi:cysteine proteinase [Suillus hirtellus]|nr:cysteine proteinase [Suillus hirtellus]
MTDIAEAEVSYVFGFVGKLKVSKNIYTRAAKYELARDWNNAFKLYLQAVDAFLRISRTTADPEYRNNAAKALDRAGKIKQFKKLTPLSTDHFSHQTSILKKSSVINNIQIPLATSSPSDSYTSPFNDPDGQPSLPTPEYTWNRPNYPNSSLPLLPSDIIQNIVNDCSVCASIAVCIQHNIRFKSNLLLSSLYSSNDGRYELKVLVNGDFRRVIIDDRLPFDSNNKLVGISTGPKNNLWPSFVEKAYMKLMGGYDFLGSNSAIDLHVLTGWIPEHLDLQSASFERERIWSRIMTAFPRGDCMMTVGTNDKTPLNYNIHSIKLFPSHDYAITDIKETNDERWVTLLDSRSCTSECGQCSGSGSYVTDVTGVLNIRWDDICATFEGLYISWNPSLFGSCVTFHGCVFNLTCVPYSNESTDHGSLKMRKIFHKDSTETEIWILLTRHLCDTRRTNEYIAINVQEDDTVLGDSEHVALKSNYTNSTHLLSRIKTSQLQTQNSGSLSILACYDGQFEEVGFTVTAYAYSSDVMVSWDTRVPPARYMQKIDGVWTHKTAGGNCTHPTYMVNPQYHLRVHNASTSIDKRPSTSTSADQRNKTQVILTTQSTRDISLNVTAVWSQGERISELSQKEVVAHSGPYTYGHARVAAHLAPGDYTVILSTYEPDQMGKFTLKVESPSRFDIKAIPQEDAGMYVKTVRGEWDSTTAVGGLSQHRYHRNPVYQVTIPCASEFGARLQLLSRVPGVSTNLSLFPSSNLQRCIASSGPYSDALSGVDIPKRSISPGKYYLVPSTYHAGVHAQFRIVVYSGVSGTEVVLHS